MASQSAPRILVELAAHSLQLALVDGGGRLVGFRQCALDAAAIAAALAELSPSTPVANVQALLVPSTGFLVRANADESASMRTAKSLLARAESAGAALDAPLNVVAFDSATGLRVDTVGASPWVLAGTPASRIEAATAQLATLGLPASSVRLALPVRIGAVVTALQDMPESTRVLVWQISETSAQVACISAGGCESVGETAAGFTQIFEAVQAGLGLKFRAAAAKLFFNSDYDFSETAGPVAERLAALLRPAITALGCAPTALYVAGLPVGQAWLAKAVAAALDLALLAPDMAAFCAQRGLAGDAANAELSASALGLLFQAAGSDDGSRAWQPDWLDANAPVVAPVAPAPAIIPAPAPAPAPVATKAPVSTVPAKPVPVAPKPAAPVAAVPASAAAKPIPAPVAAAPVAAKPAVAAKPVVAKPAAASAVAVAAPKPITPAPVLKPAAAAPVSATIPPTKAAPAPVIIEESVEEIAPAVKTEAAPKKKPVMLFAVIAAVLVLGGVGAVVMMKGGKANAELQMKAEADARLLAEELKTPRSFRNEHYSFEVSDRGVLQKLVGLSNRTIIDEFGWLELQGTFTGTAKPFYAGTIADKEFVPSIKKLVRDGKVVFEIDGKHPRFTVQTVVTCLPNALRIQTVFKPINMEEARGPISGVYTVKMNRQSLAVGQKAVVASDAVTFATQSGPVVMKFNGDAWGPAGEAGKQSVVVGSNLAFFYFAGGSNPKDNVLTTDITLP